MKPRDIHPEAIKEFRQAARNYEIKVGGLGDDFKSNVINAANRIQSGESGGSPWLKNTRLQRVHRFPYGIVFREYSDRISIIAIYHFSQREDYWVHRLEDLDEE